MRAERSSQRAANGASPRLVYSDIRLKRDILQLARLENGLRLYRFRYRWCDKLYVGVMAHEVEMIDPEAVSADDDGFLRVNYQRLGLWLRDYEDWLNKGHTDPAPLTA
jgi:hypothetical protein